MLEILIAISLILLTWGWIIPVLIGGFRLATVRGANQQARRILIAVGMIALAACWARAVQSLTWGVDHQTIRTQAGDVTATVRHIGRIYYLVVQQDGKEKHILPLFGGRPESLFWIREGKTIGVSLKGQHLIVDIDIRSDPTNATKRLSPEEKRRFDYQRKLTPDEERLFEAAERASMGQ